MYDSCEITNIEGNLVGFHSNWTLPLDWLAPNEKLLWLPHLSGTGIEGPNWRFDARYVKCPNILSCQVREFADIALYPHSDEKYDGSFWPMGESSGGDGAASRLRRHDPPVLPRSSTARWYGSARRSNPDPIPSILSIPRSGASWSTSSNLSGHSGLSELPTDR